MQRSLRISYWLALMGGIILPVLETIRRFHQMTDSQFFLYWFDDYLLGAFLLYAVWRTHRDPASGQRYLCAAWGATAFLLILSFIGQLQSLAQGVVDPAPVPSAGVAVIKGLFLVGALVGLTLALKADGVVKAPRKT